MKKIAAFLLLCAAVVGIGVLPAAAGQQVENGWNSDEYKQDVSVTCAQRYPAWNVRLTRIDPKAEERGGQVYVLVAYGDQGFEIVDKVKIAEVDQTAQLRAPVPLKPGEAGRYFIYQNNGRPHDREAVSEELVSLAEC